MTCVGHKYLVSAALVAIATVVPRLPAEAWGGRQIRKMTRRVKHIPRRAERYLLGELATARHITPLKWTRWDRAVAYWSTYKPSRLALGAVKIYAVLGSIGLATVGLHRARSAARQAVVRSLVKDGVPVPRPVLDHHIRRVRASQRLAIKRKKKAQKRRPSARRAKRIAREESTIAELREHLEAAYKLR